MNGINGEGPSDREFRLSDRRNPAPPSLRTNGEEMPIERDDDDGREGSTSPDAESKRAGAGTPKHSPIKRMPFWPHHAGLVAQCMTVDRPPSAGPPPPQEIEEEEEMEDHREDQEMDQEHQQMDMVEEVQEGLPSSPRSLDQMDSDEDERESSMSSSPVPPPYRSVTPTDFHSSSSVVQSNNPNRNRSTTADPKLHGNGSTSSKQKGNSSSQQDIEDTEDTPEDDHRQEPAAKSGGNESSSQNQNGFSCPTDQENTGGQEDTGNTSSEGSRHSEHQVPITNGSSTSTPARPVPNSIGRDAREALLNFLKCDKIIEESEEKLKELTDKFNEKKLEELRMKKEMERKKSEIKRSRREVERLCHLIKTSSLTSVNGNAAVLIAEMVQAGEQMKQTQQELAAMNIDYQELVVSIKERKPRIKLLEESIPKYVRARNIEALMLTGAPLNFIDKCGMEGEKELEKGGDVMDVSHLLYPEPEDVHATNVQSTSSQGERNPREARSSRGNSRENSFSPDRAAINDQAPRNRARGRNAARRTAGSISPEEEKRAKRPAPKQRSRDSSTTPPRRVTRSTANSRMHSRGGSPVPSLSPDRTSPDDDQAPRTRSRGSSASRSATRCADERSMSRRNQRTPRINAPVATNCRKAQSGHQCPNAPAVPSRGRSRTKKCAGSRQASRSRSHSSSSSSSCSDASPPPAPTTCTKKNNQKKPRCAPQGRKSKTCQNKTTNRKSKEKKEQNKTKQCTKRS
ncbi:hypothetical protein CAEBREN_23851 [Caenorhabditis brenneri]|uniref:Uncharacterized protein n=1 Tax=Caenorhabditis brenneri TaxID=135651 RepID=G0MCP5_CAEBE|nr:hypothetical protein CAEBREN_23851 [Caenorhabditis brenneri]